MHCYTILLIDLSYKVTEDNSIPHSLSIKVYKINEHSMYHLGNPEYRELQKILFIKNNIIPDKIWPSASEEDPCEKFPYKYGQ